MFCCELQTFDLKVDAGLNDKQLKCEIGTTASGIKSTTSTVLNVLCKLSSYKNVNLLAALKVNSNEWKVKVYLLVMTIKSNSPKYWKNLSKDEIVMVREVKKAESYILG